MINFIPLFTSDKIAFLALLPLTPFIIITIFIFLSPMIQPIVILVDILLPIFFPYLSQLVLALLEPNIVLLQLTLV